MHGLYTAIITPFHSDGSLDEEGLRKNLSFQLESGVDGVLALGSTGEATALNQEERDRVIAIACEEIQGRVPLMVGTGAASTAEAIEKTKRAESLGADFALIVTPYYSRPTQEGIYRHYAAMVKESSLPIMLYNHPGRTGTALELSTIQRLATIPQIIGIKESSGKVERVAAICRELPEFIVMSGDDSLAVESLKWGAKGLISVVANLLPKEMKRLLKGEEVDLTSFIEASALESNPIPIKTMMEMAGMPAGPLRLPLCGLQSHNLMIIEKLIESSFTCLRK